MKTVLWRVSAKAPGLSLAAQTKETFFMAKLKKKLFLGTLVMRGFSYQAAKEYDMVRRKVDAAWAEKAMCRLPFDAGFDKMFRDIITTRRVLWEERDDFPAFYALVARRDRRKVLCPLEDAGTREKLSVADVMALLRRVGGLCVRPCYNTLGGKADSLHYDGESYTLNGKATDEADVTAYLERLADDAIVLQNVQADSRAVELYGYDCPVLHASYVHQNGSHVLAEAYVADHAAEGGSRTLYSMTKERKAADRADALTCRALEIAERVKNKYPEMPYMNVAVLLGQEGAKIWQVDAGKELIWLPDCPEVTKTFLQERHLKHGVRGLRRVRKYLFSMYAKRKGFVDFMYRNWLRGLRDDNAVKTTTRQEKRWAHRRGFYSYRIKQYGLTEENYRTMLSDYAYKRLRPINGQYQKWLWDKVFMYYVLAPYQQYLPKHYCRIVQSEQGNRLISFDGETWQGTPAEAAEQLLRREKRLVAKPSVGSHGKGFMKLEWDEQAGAVRVNGQIHDKSAFAKLIDEMDTTYFLSEFVQMHPDLQKIYDKVVGTVRLIVIDLDGTPQIVSSYMRIGTDGTGHTDNLDTGGIVARVSVDSGRFDRAEMLKEHIYTPYDIHPDTGAPLEGTLPHWETIKAVVTDIAGYLYPMEYMGFDIVITADGFRILEINSHPDLHRYPEFPQEVKDYFMRKCALKGRK